MSRLRRLYFSTVLVAALVGVLVGWQYHRMLALLPAIIPDKIEIISALKPAMESMEELPTKFTWTQISSVDFKQFAANLRVAECPNDTTKLIIRGVVMRVYQAKVNELFNPLAHYWSSKAESDEVAKRIRIIRAERDNLLASLGVGFNEDDGLELPAEKQTLVNKALELYPANAPKLGSPRKDWAGFLDNRRSRVAYLSQFLTPEELIDYRINHDGGVQAVGELLKNLGTSDDEFKKAFVALDGEDVSQTNGYMRADLETKLKQALGNERYDEYHSQNTMASRVFNNFVEVSHLSVEQSRLLKEIRANYGASSESINDSAYQKAVSDLIGDQFLTRRYFNNPHLYQNIK